MRFDRLILSSNISFVGMRITLYEVDISSSERHFQSFSVVCILNQQFVFVGYSTSIFDNHPKHVAAQANNDDRPC